MCHFKNNVILFCSHHKNFVQDYFFWVCECSKLKCKLVYFLFYKRSHWITVLSDTCTNLWDRGRPKPCNGLENPMHLSVWACFYGCVLKIKQANSRWGGFGILKISILNPLLTMLEPSTLVSVANVQPTKQTFPDRVTRIDFL